MTPDEARKLVGQYATGSLTEAERASLFEAALEDQELFDELAGEHSLKELINSPGVRKRLLAALTPTVEEKPRRVWWPWAAVLACGIAAGTAWILMPRPVEAPVQVAQTVNMSRSEPSQAAVTAAVPQIEKAAKPRSSAPKPTAPMSSPAALPPPVVATPPVAPLTELPLLKTESIELQQRFVPEPMADQSSARIFAKGGAAKGVPNAAGAVTGPPFTYEFTTNRKLRIVAAQPGTLLVTVGTQIIFARNPVLERIPIELAMPDEAVSIRIEFTPSSGTPFIVIPSVPQ